MRYRSSPVSAYMGEFRPLGLTVPNESWDVIDAEARRRNISKSEMLRPYIEKIVNDIQAQYAEHESAAKR